MASRQRHSAGRLAVERALSRMAGVAPDSVEVVELVRGRAFVVARTGPSAVLVLDEGGRLVRGRERLAAIASHLRTLELVRQAVAQAQLDRGLEQAERGIAALERLRRRHASTRLGERVADVLIGLRALAAGLEAVRAEVGRASALPPTERTLRRTVALLNDAAAADRRVVRAVRRLAAELASVEMAAGSGRSLTTGPLRRWALARLEAADLPFFYPELDEPEGVRFVECFVTAARG